MTTVLLIEDDDLLCRAFKRSLELRGVTTIQASSVEEGQRLFHAHRDSRRHRYGWVSEQPQSEYPPTDQRDQG